MRIYEVDVTYTEPGGEPQRAAIAVEADDMAGARAGARDACVADQYHPSEFEAFSTGRVRRMDLGPAAPTSEERP